MELAFATLFGCCRYCRWSERSLLFSAVVGVGVVSSVGAVGAGVVVFATLFGCCRSKGRWCWSWRRSVRYYFSAVVAVGSGVGAVGAGVEVFATIFRLFLA